MAVYGEFSMSAVNPTAHRDALRIYSEGNNTGKSVALPKRPSRHTVKDVRTR